MTNRLKCSTPATLRKYGMDAEMWYTMLDLQDGKCPICQREFTQELRPVVDHEHRKGYKKMKSGERRKFVRGLVCNYDNRRRIPTNSKGITATEIAWNVYLYLSDYNARLLDE